MSDDYDFDVAIIGAGPAGTAAALTLAKGGIEVVVVERGQYPGAKNVSGGALYGPVINELIPKYWEEEGFERFLTTKKISLLSDNKAVTIDINNQNFKEPPYNGVTITRPKFDRWLAKKAEEAGAMILLDTVVEDFVWEGDQILGIKSGNDIIKSKLTIIAEGSCALLTEKAGLAKFPKPEHYAVALKETYELPSDVIESRYGLEKNEGFSNEMIGYAEGIPGGGFFYTNRDTLSFGLILNLKKLTKKKLKSTDVFEQFKTHPYIQKLIQDAKMIEYSSHTIPEGGFKHMSKLYGNGVLVAGEAAGMLLNAGLYIEGMNFALEAGKIAGEAAIEILKLGDFSSNGTKIYENKLKKSFVYKDLKTFKRAAKFLDTDRIFTKYPDLITGLMEKLLTNTGKPRKRIVKTAVGYVLKTMNIFSLIKDAIGGWRSI